MLQLALTLAGLLLGPIVYPMSRRREEIYGFLDGFVLIGVAGLVLTEVLPDTLKSLADPRASGMANALGMPAVGLAFAAAGFIFPFLLEKNLSLLPFSPNKFFRWLMILGLLLHQLLDGVALSDRVSQTSAMYLKLAVVLHQVPKGFFIWGLVGEAMGYRVGGAVIASLCAATVAGFGLGDRLAAMVAAKPLWLFQAFIAGGLLHVIFHHVPRPASRPGCSDDGCGCSASEGARSPASARFTLWSGLGAIVSLVGLVTLALLERSEESGSPGGFLGVFASIAVESAPSLLLGFAAAGLFQAFLPRVVFSWFFGGKGRMSQALRGIAVGVPLPICSCGVVPVYLSLLKKSVPPAAALAFLIATPEIGIDSFFLSSNLLGMQVTLIRLGMAFLIALAVAVTLARTFEKIQRSGELDRLPAPEERPAPLTFRGKLREAARFGGLEIVDHTGAWLLVGIGVAAALAPADLTEWLRRVPAGIDVLVLSLLGLPLYVCATGATPIAAMLIHNGLSTGAALAFLITGPSTNVTTFGILKRYHGLRGALLFAAAVYGFSIAIGFLINAVFPAGVAPLGRDIAHAEHGPFHLACAAAVAALFALSILRLGPRGFLASLGESIGRLPGDRRGHEHGHGNRHHHVQDPVPVPVPGPVLDPDLE